MLNPLTRNQPSPNDESPGDGSGSDIESPVPSPDATGYIGKRNIHFLEIFSVSHFRLHLISNNHFDNNIIFPT
jgi:hypothetical protein